MLFTFMNLEINFILDFAFERKIGLSQLTDLILLGVQVLPANCLTINFNLSNIIRLLCCEYSSN
jgi:hypothetical protein